VHLALGIANTDSEPMNQATVSKEVAEFMDEDAIVTFDGGQTMEWSGTFVQIRHPRQKLLVRLEIFRFVLYLI
jgi:thiamine pyrophosphate-dependent acetolactate synthase large subunit-like protein